MLPDYYRGTWRKYHVPSKHDNFMRAAGVSQQQQRVGVSPCQSSSTPIATYDLEWRRRVNFAMTSL